MLERPTCGLRPSLSRPVDNRGRPPRQSVTFETPSRPACGAAMFHRRHVQPFTDPSGTDPGRAEPMPRALKDAYLLFLNPPPDALRLFDRLARQPARHAGALVFLSDLTAELANEGLTWLEVGIDYEAVTDGVVALHRRRALRALRLTQR